jgi:hypothetical protein
MCTIDGTMAWDVAAIVDTSVDARDHSVSVAWQLDTVSASVVPLDAARVTCQVAGA